RRFDEFTTQYLNKCDDLLSFSKRYPVVKQTEQMTVQRQNRNPHEDHRWLRRDVTLHRHSYDDLRRVLFTARAEHLPRWMPHLLAADRIETIVPLLCEVWRYSYKSQGLKAKRDYCQLVVMREFVGESARLKPRIFTPSASMTNLLLQRANGRNASQTSLNLFSDNAFSSSSAKLAGAVSPTMTTNRGLKSARSMADFQKHHQIQQQRQQQQQQQNNYPYNNNNNKAAADSDDELDNNAALVRPIRRFQVVTIPIDHGSCGVQRGFVRAYYESYEEVREYSDGHLEWSCIHHSDFSGWVPSFMADHSIATAFPKEAEALLEYIN
ncbi:hypothetical protein IWW38_005245, partial [Coemansia aciculifera]